MMIETEFEKKHVIDVYSQISNHFNNTRGHIWPKVKEFINSMEVNSKVSDVGCGNGRNCLERQDELNYIGFEIVDNFIEISRSKGINVIKSNILDIQSPDDIYDYTMCIAVIHHLDSEERRIKAIQELVRITKPGGKILIYVWAKEQKKFSHYHENNIMVPWKVVKTGEVYDRFYYLFENGELETLVEKSNTDVNIIEKGYQRDNYYVIIQK